MMPALTATHLRDVLRYASPGPRKPSTSTSSATPAQSSQAPHARQQGTAHSETSRGPVLSGLDKAPGELVGAARLMSPELAPLREQLPSALSKSKPSSKRATFVSGDNNEFANTLAHRLEKALPYGHEISNESSTTGGATSYGSRDHSRRCSMHGNRRKSSVSVTDFGSIAMSNTTSDASAGTVRFNVGLRAESSRVDGRHETASNVFAAMGRQLPMGALSHLGHLAALTKEPADSFGSRARTTAAPRGNSQIHICNHAMFHFKCGTEAQVHAKCKRRLHNHSASESHVLDTLSPVFPPISPSMPPPPPRQSLKELHAEVSSAFVLPLGNKYPAKSSVNIKVNEHAQEDKVRVALANPSMPRFQGDSTSASPRSPAPPRSPLLVHFGESSDSVSGPLGREGRSGGGAQVARGTRAITGEDAVAFPVLFQQSRPGERRPPRSGLVFA